MKTYQAVKPGKGSYIEVETPVPKDDEILVKVRYCGVCGTDYALFSGNSSFVRNNQADYPMRLGHEWSGIVAAVGPKVTKVRVGDPVVGDNYVSCGVCPACQKGDYNGCTGRHHVGTINPRWPGAFAEYYLAPERHIYRLADHVSLKQAALCEPLSVAWGGVKKMDIKEDSVVAVIGTGSIGMAAAALAKYKGSKHVYLVGRNEMKLNVAKSLDIAGTINTSQVCPEEELKRLTGGKLADFVLECSGAPAAIAQSLNVSAQNALIAVIGFYEKKLPDFDIDQLVSKQIQLIGIMGEYGNLEAVANIMTNYDLKLDTIITGNMDFYKDMDRALAPEDPHKVIKTMVYFGGQA